MKIEMSAKAVTARLRLTSQLRRLCLSLAQSVKPRVGSAEKAVSSRREKVPRDANK
jgi:hypothetical protein